MEIKKIVENKTLTLELTGNLDIYNAYKLDEEIMRSFFGMQTLVFDFAQLEYISSAGLKVLLKYQKLAYRWDCVMKIKNVTGIVKEILDKTGFSDFLNIVDNPVKKLSVEF